MDSTASQEQVALLIRGDGFVERVPLTPRFAAWLASVQESRSVDCQIPGCDSHAHWRDAVRSGRERSRE